ncbi:MAG: aldo/keto reductase [Planctomycetota bacterium]|nr:aldo/keto reductase [Planctomycetota bacterium]
MTNVRWGLLAAGGIAGAYAHALQQTASKGAAAVASRDKAKAQKFADNFKIPKVYGSYEELLADKDIDAVYISTPHPHHAEWAIKAADAGKHMVCEKPLTMSLADTMTVIEAARRNNVFLMEAFMYRCTPQTAKVYQLIRDGAIGQVRIINASFAFTCGYGNPDGRLMNPALGGGGILDVGCYTVSMARLIAGAALGKDFADPIDVQGAGHIGKTGVDEWAAATLKFDNDILARLLTGVQINAENSVVIWGSDGRIEIPSPWFVHGREPGSASFTLQRGGKDPEQVPCPADKGIYALEAEIAMTAIAKGHTQAPCPAMSWGDSLSQARTIDRWRAAIGLSYPCETVAAYAQPLDRKPLAIRSPNKMPYGEIPGVGKKISRLIMGTMAQENIGHATALFDDFYARGGNAFDTAHIYAGGNTEVLLGQWLKNRGLREKVVVIVKGAHPPATHVQGIREQFNVSLDRLKIDYADMYFMHRDNTDIPVGEFVDCLNELKAAGRVRAFGGSNWTKERIDAANAYAAKAGKTGFVAVSNNFSLAQMLNPLWGGCLASSTPEYRAWHKKTQIANLAWSAQARGFFDPARASKANTSDPGMVATWYSDDNFRRQGRAIELAAKYKCHPMAIATAYVLGIKDFPLFAMVGPATLEESAATFAALDVQLTDKEVRWLNLED